MNFLSTLLLICIVKVKFNDASSPAGAPWGYYHSPAGVKTPSEWKDAFITCGGHRQSPIDIQTSRAKYTEHMGPITIIKEDDTHAKVAIEKHRSSVYLTFTDIWKIKFGELKCLKPVSIHWHWGSKSSQGSEHTVDGKAYPIEAHLICFNCEKYTSITSAKDSEDGLYVIGVFYKMGIPNAALNNILESMEPILLKNLSTVNIQEIPPNEILPTHLEKYYQYDGSLTTPPCTENVRWTIISEPLTVDETQLDKFRSLVSDSIEIGKMADNYRKAMNAGNRAIISSFKSALSINWNKISLGIEMMAMLIIFSYQ